MDYGDDYWGLYMDYYSDPFPHSLPSTRQTKEVAKRLGAFGSARATDGGSARQWHQRPLQGKECQMKLGQ